MNNMLQLICIAAIGIEFIFMFISALILNGVAGKTSRKVFGAFGCLLLLFTVAALLFGLLGLFDIRLALLGDVFYGIFDYILIWAILGFGIIIALYALIVGFILKGKPTKVEKEKVEFKETVDEEPSPKRVPEDLFAGLDGVEDIDGFLGDMNYVSDGAVEEKIKTLKKLEKLLK